MLEFNIARFLAFSLNWKSYFLKKFTALYSGVSKASTVINFVADKMSEWDILHISSMMKESK